MSSTPRTIDIAFWNYDRTRALIDGSVRIEGVELRYRSDVIVSDIFKRMIRDREFHVSELGLTFYLRTLDFDDPPFVALPVFPNRFFRHSSVFVNKRSGIAAPRDLAGKRVGELSTYGHDAGIWAKGIIAEEFCVDPLSYGHVIGGIDEPGSPHDWIPQPHPAGANVTAARPGQALGPMLESGEIDALFSAIVPQCILERSPNVGRLFENYEEVEREYFTRTSIFPIMHTVVMRRDVYEADPALARALYRGFCEAKERAVRQYAAGSRFHHAPMMIPWFSKLMDEDRALMGDDWWPYGLRANRKALETFLRYHREQGLSQRRLTPEELFVPELLDT
jgi:4,5-dihydroxyphthalate decarboxylase